MAFGHTVEAEPLTLHPCHDKWGNPLDELSSATYLVYEDRLIDWDSRIEDGPRKTDPSEYATDSNRSLRVNQDIEETTHSRQPPHESIIYDGEPIGAIYVCPYCNAGESYVKRRYNGAGAEPIKAVTEGSKQAVGVHVHVWETPQPFQKHMRQRHLTLFSRGDSTEFVCQLYPCTVVWGDAVWGLETPCSGRYEHSEDLLNHLTTSHAQKPDEIMPHDHRCAPLSSFLLQHDQLPVA